MQPASLKGLYIHKQQLSWQHIILVIEHVLPQQQWGLMLWNKFHHQKAGYIKIILSFGGKSSLKTHVQSVHEKLQPFSCVLCEKSFSQEGEPKKHVQSDHEKLKLLYHHNSFDKLINWSATACRACQYNTISLSWEAFFGWPYKETCPWKPATFSNKACFF